VWMHSGDRCAVAFVAGRGTSEAGGWRLEAGSQRAEGRLLGHGHVIKTRGPSRRRPVDKVPANTSYSAFSFTWEDVPGLSFSPPSLPPSLLFSFSPPCLLSTLHSPLPFDDDVSQIRLARWLDHDASPLDDTSLVLPQLQYITGAALQPAFS
jgi:hypothetical protein